jgi:hypothetical protein
MWQAARRTTGICRRAAGVLIATSLALGAGTAALAQETPKVITPLSADLDHNGVDLLTGKLQMKGPTLSIQAAPRLSYDRLSNLAPYISGVEPAFGSGNYSAHTGRGPDKPVCVCRKRSGQWHRPDWHFV